MTDSPAYTVDGAKPNPLAKLLSSNFFRRGFWAMGDQGVVSTGNFVTNILLIRHLPKDAFGVFVLVLEQILFLNSLQAAMIVYPMSLHGAKMPAEQFRKFATGCLILAGIFALPLMAVMCGFAGFVSWKAKSVGMPLEIGILAACATALWQLQELLRRGLIAQIRYSAVVWGDGISYLGQAAALLAVVHFRNELNLPVVLCIMGLTSAAAAVLQALQIGLTRFGIGELKPLARDCWTHGRWAMAACFVTLLTASSFGWLLAGVYGLAAVGAFGVLGTVLKLSNPIQSSINGLITPVVSRAHARLGASGAVRSALKYAAVGGAMLLPYYALLLIFPYQSLRIATKNQAVYMTSEMVTSLRIYVFSFALIYMSSILGTILNGLGRSKLGFFAQALNMFITVLIALPLIYWLGVRGAVLGGLACTFGWTVANIWFLVQAVRDDHEPVEMK